MSTGVGGDEEDSNYIQFNSPDDAFIVEVGTAELGEEQLIELHSSTGQVIVGSATLSPGSGPVGTEHQLVVIVIILGKLVEQVRLEVDSGERGLEDRYFKSRFCRPGYHTIDIVSVGEENETRTDTFQFS